MTNKTTSAIDLVERLNELAEIEDETTAHYSDSVPNPFRMAADTITRLQAALDEVRAERDALLQKPLDLAKMDSIDEDVPDKMLAYYWWQQAQDARSSVGGE